VKRALALIDGDHRADVVRDAIAVAPYDVVGALLAGGTEKLRGGEDYGVPLVGSLAEANADVVLDLSDEPVLGPAARMRLASQALALGMAYVGPDFRFEPPRFEHIASPSLAVIGTGKRVGKTAVVIHAARTLARERDVVVVAMGRGGPAQPELVETPPTLDELLARSRAGQHATSDFLETAVFAGVRTIGCRRAGGGLAGRVFDSNVDAAVEVVQALDPELVLFDGSGAAVPPVAADARILVSGPHHDLDAYLNPYRVLISDLVVLVGGGRPPTVKDVPVVRAELRLRPQEPLEGRVAVFTAGAAPVDHLDADVVCVSRSLADRAALRRELAGLEADTFLVELKGAAVDVVAEAAAARGVRVVVAENEVVAIDGDLDAAILGLVPQEARV
jgi:cyclic 2,3-diphosphoglycerate synthetase